MHERLVALVQLVEFDLRAICQGGGKTSELPDAVSRGTGTGCLVDEIAGALLDARADAERLCSTSVSRTLRDEARFWWTLAGQYAEQIRGVLTSDAVSDWRWEDGLCGGADDLEGIVQPDDAEAGWRDATTLLCAEHFLLDDGDAVRASEGCDDLRASVDRRRIGVCGSGGAVAYFCAQVDWFIGRTVEARQAFAELRTDLAGCTGTVGTGLQDAVAEACADVGCD